MFALEFKFTILGLAIFCKFLLLHIYNVNSKFVFLAEFFVHLSAYYFHILNKRKTNNFLMHAFIIIHDSIAMYNIQSRN